MPKPLAALLLVWVLPALTALAGDPVEPGWALRQKARQEVGAGKRHEALATLEQLVNLKTGYDPAQDAGIAAALKDDPRWKALVERHQQEYPAIVHSLPVFSVSEPGLIPEGIAYDPVDKVFYLGSLPGKKILRISLTGEFSNFTSPGANPLGEPLGLHLDQARRTLWAASESTHECGVFGFDLKSGRLLRRAILPKPGHLLNDLVVSPRGDLYVTDSEEGLIYRLAAGSDRLEPLNIPLRSPNGIAISGDGKVLFVSEMETGILRIDLATMKAEPLGRPAGLSLLGIDGLYFDGKSLIGVHNWYGSPQIVRYILDPKRAQITAVEVLERRDPRWNLPTTGAIADGWFYFMANTQIDRLKDGAITEGPPLAPILVLKTKLADKR